MILFFLGMFLTSTILLLVFIIRFYDLSVLRKEKVYKENINIKKDFDELEIDKSPFFK